MKLVSRHGYPVEIWKVKYRNKGFDYVIFIQGTEPEMQEYVKWEFGYIGSYHAITDDEYECVKKLDLPVYLAPQL